MESLSPLKVKKALKTFPQPSQRSYEHPQGSKTSLQRETIPRLPYLRLALRFFWFGLRGFGGATAQVAMMKEELIIQEKWMPIDRFHQILAIYQTLPGPEAIELACYFGMASRGVFGAWLSASAFMFPGFLLMLLCSWLYTVYGFRRISTLNASFDAMQPAVLALIVRAVHTIAQHALLGSNPRDSMQNPHVHDPENPTTSLDSIPFSWNQKDVVKENGTQDGLDLPRIFSIRVDEENMDSFTYSSHDPQDKDMNTDSMDQTKVEEMVTRGSHTEFLQVRNYREGDETPESVVNSMDSCPIPHETGNAHNPCISSFESPLTNSSQCPAPDPLLLFFAFFAALLNVLHIHFLISLVILTMTVFLSRGLRDLVRRRWLIMLTVSWIILTFTVYILLRVFLNNPLDISWPYSLSTNAKLQNSVVDSSDLFVFPKKRGFLDTPCAANLFLVGLLAGSLSFGGAHTVISILREILVERTCWIPHQVFLDSIALVSILPAPTTFFVMLLGQVAMQSIWGGVLMTLGVILPAFLLPVLGHALFMRMLRNSIINHVLEGLLAGMVGIMTLTTMRLINGNSKGQNGLFPTSTGVVLFVLALAILYAADRGCQSPRIPLEHLEKSKCTEDQLHCSETTFPNEERLQTFPSTNPPFHPCTSSTHVRIALREPFSSSCTHSKPPFHVHYLSPTKNQDHMHVVHHWKPWVSVLLLAAYALVGQVVTP